MNKKINYVDKNGNPFVDGSIFDIGQTVNGQSKFVILTLFPLDIRYHHDLNYKYQYDMIELLQVKDSIFYSEVEIVGNIQKNNYL